MLLDIIKSKAHGHQVAYFIFATLVLAIATGLISLRQSRRWMTGVLALLLVIPGHASPAAWCRRT